MNDKVASFWVRLVGTFEHVRTQISRPQGLTRASPRNFFLKTFRHLRSQLPDFMPNLRDARFDSCFEQVRQSVVAILDGVLDLRCFDEVLPVFNQISEHFLRIIYRESGAAFKKRINTAIDQRTVALVFGYVKDVNPVKQHEIVASSASPAPSPSSADTVIITSTADVTKIKVDRQSEKWASESHYDRTFNPLPPNSHSSSPPFRDFARV